MNVDPPFRLPTVDVLLSLLRLITDELTEDEAKLYKSAYEIARKNARKIFKDGENDMSINLIKNEWEFYFNFRTERKDNYKRILLNIGLLREVPYNPNDIITKYLKFPLSKHEITKSQIKVFMLLKETYERLFKTQSYSSLLEDIKDASITDTFTLPKDSKLIKCEELVDEDNYDRYILEDPEYFILLDRDSSKSGKLIKKLGIAGLKVILDSNRPKCLTLRIGNDLVTPRTQCSGGIELCFDNTIECNHMKSYIEECAEKYISMQVADIVKDLSNTKGN